LLHLGDNLPVKVFLFVFCFLQRPECGLKLAVVMPLHNGPVHPKKQPAIGMIEFIVDLEPAPADGKAVSAGRLDRAELLLNIPPQEEKEQPNKAAASYDGTDQRGYYFVRPISLLSLHVIHGFYKPVHL
jgi:hypothetical protein